MFPVQPIVLFRTVFTPIQDQVRNRTFSLDVMAFKSLLIYKSPYTIPFMSFILLAFFESGSSALENVPYPGFV